MHVCICVLCAEVGRVQTYIWKALQLAGRLSLAFSALHLAPAQALHSAPHLTSFHARVKWTWFDAILWTRCLFNASWPSLIINCSASPWIKPVDMLSDLCPFWRRPPPTEQVVVILLLSISTFLFFLHTSPGVFYSADCCGFVSTNNLSENSGDLLTQLSIPQYSS